MNQAVYKFSIHAGSHIEGMFVLSDNDYTTMMSQDEIYLGEIAGKHSEVILIPESGDFQKLSEDPVIVEFIVNNPVGVNPFDYIEE